MSKNTEMVGSHEPLRREDTFKTATDRNFGVVFAVVFGLIGLLIWWRSGHHWVWWLGGSAFFAGVALVAPRILAPLNWVWTKFGLLLFHIVSPIMLAVLFYVCIAPIGVILRFMKKDLLRLHYDPSADSYWIKRDPPGPAPDSLKNQF